MFFRNILKLTLFFALFTTIGCENVKEKNLYFNDEGIFFEAIDSTNTDANRYTADNTIFKPGRKFVYSYYYQDIDSTKYLFRAKYDKTDPEISNYLISEKDSDRLTIVKLTLAPKSENPFSSSTPQYKQTGISYNYILRNNNSIGYENTGLVENEKNVWVHPPRTNFFSILELNPFPFIMSPYEIGTKWTWSLNIGPQWADKKWKTWDGQITNLYTYEIIDKKVVPTKLGNLECYIVHGIAESRIGKTELIAYFNREFGFVRLNYTNIDGTKTILELEEVSWSLTSFDE